MVRIPKNGSTLKQMAYARRVFGAKGKIKKYIALDVGYGNGASNSISSKIEKSVGFNNAMAKLALESNNVALSVLHEFRARGVKDFSNKDLVGALNAIGNAWSKFNPLAKAAKDPSQDTNKLRTIIMQKIENQTMSTANPPDEIIKELRPDEVTVEEKIDQMEPNDDIGF